MKTLLALLLTATLAAGQTTGDYLLTRKAASGYTQKTITPENGKVLGWDSSGNPVAITPITSLSWEAISGKPATFPPDVSAIADGALSIAKTSGLQTALDAKVDDSQLSASGGANKVLQLDASGNITTSGSYAQSGGTFGGAGNISIPDLQGFRWMKRDGTASGAGIYHWQEHDALGGEFIIQSPWRIALIPYGPLQVGPNDAGRYPRKLQLVSGYASGSQPALEYMPSGALAFQSSVWDGDSCNQNEISLQAHALDTTGTNSILRVWDQASVTNEDGGGNAFTAGRGDVSGNLIAEIYRDGIWSAGTAPAFASLTDGATITQECSKYKTVQPASVTLAGNRTLSISGALAGMRGVIYVTQDATGSRTLTPTGGSALDLSTTASATDKIVWEFDGTYFNFEVTKNIQREVIVADSDAQAFITAASITNATQKVAVDTLVQALKTASLWTRFYALYPFVGGTSTAHAQDLKAAYDITWAGTPTHNANGVTGNAMDARGDTGINLFSLGVTNSVSGYIYSRTQTPTDGAYFMGCTTSTTRFGMARSGASLGYHGPNSQANLAVTANSEFRGHFLINRSSSTAVDINVGATRTNITDAVVSAPNGQIRLLCREVVGNPGGYSNVNLAFAAIGQSLTAGEYTTFMGIVDAFQTTLGRKNP